MKTLKIIFIRKLRNFFGAILETKKKETGSKFTKFFLSNL